MVKVRPSRTQKQEFESKIQRSIERKSSKRFHGSCSSQALRAGIVWSDYAKRKSFKDNQIFTKFYNSNYKLYKL